MSTFYSRPHRRYNPMLGEWILVSPHRTQRPWQGQTEDTAGDDRPSYDPACYLCPGNIRAGGDINPAYDSTFVFTNDYASLLPDVPGAAENKEGLLVAESESGICRVICFSPRHNLTLGRMKTEDIAVVVDVWAKQTEEIGANPDIAYVQVFENKGAVMGCSNPHPHGQIWATRHIPNLPAIEEKTQREYMDAKGSCMLCNYLKIEADEKERIVCENEHFAVVVPYWATWPFETMLISRRHVGSIPELSPDERAGLAEMIRTITCKYDHVFDVSFPYSFGWHQKPTDGGDYRSWHLHAHFYPPLLRSATVKKFMVGYEMLAMPQRDLTAESAAERLRELAEE